jgi:hypothetical protein
LNSSLLVIFLVNTDFINPQGLGTGLFDQIGQANSEILDNFQLVRVHMEIMVALLAVPAIRNTGVARSCVEIGMNDMRLF